MSKAGRKKSKPGYWREVKLGEIAEISKETWKVGDKPFPYIGLEHIEENTLRLNSIGDSNNLESNKYRFKSGDVLFGKLRPYFRKVVKPKFDGICSTDIWVIQAKENMDARFMFYFFANRKLVDIAYSSCSGTRMPRADWSFLSQTVWDIPPLAEQEAIADVLSSLDDKIDLLHRQNKTLEDMAQALFRQWFSHGAKKDWETGKLGDILEVIESGSRPKGGVDKNIKMGILSVGAENINGIGNFNFSKSRFIPISFFQKMKKGVVKNYDVLIYKDGAYIGKKAMFGNNFPFKQFAVNEHVFILRANNRANQLYLYFSLEQEELSSLNANSAQPGLNQQAMKSFDILIPPKTIISKFGQIVKPMIDKILSNSSQIHLFEKLHDTLLPKLISGKVSVRP